MEESQGQIDSPNTPQPRVPAPSSGLPVPSSPLESGTVLIAAAGPPFYIASPKSGPFLQTEILSGVIEYRLALDSISSPDGLEFESITHSYAIIVSQDCDLSQDYSRREKLKREGLSPEAVDEKLLPRILLCEVSPESAISGAMQGMTVRDRFRQNKEERYQFLKAVESQYDAENCGIEAMGIDFKRYFSVPTGELYTQLQCDCRRRCRLAPQYLEHFSRRFTNHLSRVALPSDHHR